MESTLEVSQSLKMGEKLVSPNGLFKLDVQSDGNIVCRTCNDNVYWSPNCYQGGRNSCTDVTLIVQSDGNLVVKGNGKVLWSPNCHQGGKNSVPNAKLYLQNDGNLVMRGNGKVLWAHNIYFKIEANSIDNFKYDNKPSSTHTNVLQTFSFSAENDSDETAPNTFGVEISYSNTKSFDTSMGVTVGSSATIKSGIPKIAEAEVTVSVEASFGVSWGKTESETYTADSSVTINVPKNSKGKAIITVTQDKYEIPFTAKGTYSITSIKGDKKFSFRGPFKGIFKGSDGYSINSHLQEVEDL